MRELVDIHLLSSLVGYTGGRLTAGQLRKSWTRAALISSEERPAARMFACMEMANCALAWAITCGDRVGVAGAAAAGAGGGGSAAFQVLTSCECVPWHFPSA
jgi:hypothetical protein